MKNWNVKKLLNQNIANVTYEGKQKCNTFITSSI